jgi:hypothetical protein
LLRRRIDGPLKHWRQLATASCEAIMANRREDARGKCFEFRIATIKLHCIDLRITLFKWKLLKSAAENVLGLDGRESRPASFRFGWINPSMKCGY